MAPLVVHQEEEGEDRGEEDQNDADHHHEAAVKKPAEKTGMVTSLGDADHCNYNGECFTIIIIIIIFLFSRCSLLEVPEPTGAPNKKRLSGRKVDLSLQ